MHLSQQYAKSQSYDSRQNKTIQQAIKILRSWKKSFKLK